MPTITPQTDPERSLDSEAQRSETPSALTPDISPETPTPGAPLTFVPHDPNGLHSRFHNGFLQLSGNKIQAL